jgi:hypothetical protein
MSASQSLPELFRQVTRQETLSSAAALVEFFDEQSDNVATSVEPSASAVKDVLTTSSLLPDKPDLAVTSAVAYHLLVACSAFPTDPEAARDSFFYNLVHNVVLRDAEDPSTTAVDMVTVFGAEPGGLKEVTLSPESDPVSVYDVTEDPAAGITDALSALTVDDNDGFI